MALQNLIRLMYLTAFISFAGWLGFQEFIPGFSFVGYQGVFLTFLYLLPLILGFVAHSEFSPVLAAKRAEALKRPKTTIHIWIFIAKFAVFLLILNKLWNIFVYQILARMDVHYSALLTFGTLLPIVWLLMRTILLQIWPTPMSGHDE